MISLKVKANAYGKLKKLTMVTGTIIACMERESSHGLMGRNTQVKKHILLLNCMVNLIYCLNQVIFIRINSMDMASLSGRMGLATKVSGNKAKCTELGKSPRQKERKSQEHGSMENTNGLLMKLQETITALTIALITTSIIIVLTILKIKPSTIMDLLTITP